MLTCLVSASGASAFGLGSLSKSSDSDKAAATAPAQSLDDVLNTQEALVRRYMTAAASVNEAQIKFAKALNMKKEAAALQDQQKVLTSGSVIADAKSLKKMTKLSKSTNKAISENMQQEKNLSKEAKAEISKGLVYLAASIVETKNMIDEFEPFIESAQSQISSVSPMKMRKIKKKLDSGLYVATKTPGQLANLTTTATKMISFAQSNNIKIPKEATTML